MNELLSNISAKEWLFALIVAIVVTTSSSIITYLIKNMFEKRKATRDYLLPLFSEFTDSIVFERIDLNYNNKCLPDWIEYLNYTNRKISEMMTYLSKFDLALNIHNIQYIKDWNDLFKKGVKITESLMREIDSKQVDPIVTVKNIHSLANETAELSNTIHDYILDRIKKYV